jgi:hypothetical protein
VDYTYQKNTFTLPVVLDAIEISSPLFKLSNKCRLKIYNGVARCYYTPAPRRGRGYTVLPLSVCPFVIPSVRPSVRPRYFLSHFSQ